MGDPGEEWNFVGEGAESDSEPCWSFWKCWSPTGGGERGRRLGRLVDVWAELGVG